MEAVGHVLVILLASAALVSIVIGVLGLVRGVGYVLYPPVHYPVHSVGDWMNVVPNDFEGDFADGVLMVQADGSLCTSGDTLEEHLADCTGRTLLFHLNSGYARAGGTYLVCAVSLDKKPDPKNPLLCTEMETGKNEESSLDIPANFGKFYVWGAWVEDLLIVDPWN